MRRSRIFAKRSRAARRPRRPGGSASAPTPRSFPPSRTQLGQSVLGQLPSGWDADIPEFPADAKGMATRVASGKVMNAIAARLPALTGGSADLDPSTHTELKGLGDFNPPALQADDTQGSAGGGWSYAGRNVHFGVREHAMGAIVNGMAAHGGTLPYGATFLIFSDYMRPPIRLAALMGLHVIHVFTHDSIALGEDGPTHEPVEQLAGLRAIPNLTLIRPADANETAVAWKVALETRDRPVLLVLSRQSVPTLDRRRYASADGLRRGAYVLLDAVKARPDLILIASGAEVALIVSASESAFAARASRCAAFRCRAGTFSSRCRVPIASGCCRPSVAARLAVEAGSPQGWCRYVGDRGDVLAVDRFGASAPGKEVLDQYGFTVDNVCNRARALL